jgi:hypothetical protein
MKQDKTAPSTVVKTKDSLKGKMDSLKGKTDSLKGKANPLKDTTHRSKENVNSSKDQMKSLSSHVVKIPKARKVVRSSHGACIRLTSVAGVSRYPTQSSMGTPIILQKDRWSHPVWVGKLS